MANIFHVLFRKEWCTIRIIFQPLTSIFLNFQGYQIPKGWSLVYSIRDTHETTNAFDNHKEFDPSRWEKNPLEENTYNYIPFGGGKRLCVGREYAKLLLKVLAIQLVTYCSFHLNSNPVVKMLPSPRPVDNLPMTFKWTSKKTWVFVSLASRHSKLRELQTGNNY